MFNETPQTITAASATHCTGHQPVTEATAARINASSAPRMITSRQRYEDRHRKICQRAEQRFAEDRTRNPRLTVPKTVRGYAVAVRLAIKRRDTIAAVLATQCAHIAMKAPMD